MKQITQWLDPHKIIDSEYGNVTYKEWCELERKRISKEKCIVRKDDSGHIAVFKK